MNQTHVIVGAGQAGGWAAVTMRKHGFTGRIVLIGDEPHVPYERPPLSKSVLTAEGEIPVQPFRAREAYEQLNIELQLGVRANEVDVAAGYVHLDDGNKIGFDRLLFATGGRARRLCVPGAEHVVTLRTYADALALRRMLARSGHVICIGGGVIGLECASSASALGCAVTVIDSNHRLMGRALPADAAEHLLDLHLRAGVRFRFGAEVMSVAATPRGLSVELSDGTAVTGDCVIAGIGIERQTELAQTAGLLVKGGIVTNPFGETSATGIYAAGEVAAFWQPVQKQHVLMETWQHAQNHGVAVGRAMAEDPRPYDDLPWFWSDQHGVNLQVAGFPHDEHQKVTRHLGGGSVTIYQAANGLIAGAVGFDCGREIRALQALMRSGQRVDPAELANPDILLRHLKAETI
jgi:3-phenylpropionate/trans-cinnamate dioxygenase ferredoxin reductase subunit